MKHCLVFASLISPSKMILFEKKYQTFDTVFHHQMKHLEVCQKYSAARRIFNSLLGVSSGDETLHLMFDILHKGDVTRDDSQRRLLAQHSVAMLKQCCNHSKQYHNIVVTMYCANNCRCELSRVTSAQVSLTTPQLEFSRCLFAQDCQEMYQKV